MRSDPPGFFVTTLAPSLGVVLSNVLYLAPLPAVRKAQRHMQLQGLNPIPLALMALNTVGFLAYGLAVPNRYVVASNVLGIVLAVWYLATVLPLVRDEPSLQQLKLVLVGGASFLVLEITWATLFLAEEKERAGVLGANATAVCVLMFAAPLSTLSEVCRTRSSSTIYGPLTTAQVCNCFLWTVYGAAVGDVWVTGPNSIGLLLGLVQAALLAILPSTSASAVTPEEGKAILSDME
ncbi:hypothetical protein KFE25_002694 [Diacronema lutheri]|uniref:Sugar transporter SWEET1 n=1 Tax=Diacronema lutheri TaxID=2081491 RepID=A0A8J5XJB8_DIALT|nr:hypothetical protein KFE25_002694 [Diacronema lutheri]